ncbi:MAG: NAD-dependent epimerase/dehydratase family protein [Nitrospirota bacterium]
MTDPYTGKGILITGSSGYVATKVIAMLEDTDCRIIRLSRTGSRLKPVNGVARVKNVIGDVRERATWEEALQDTDIIFHFAAQTSVHAADENPIADLEANVVPMLHLLEACRRRGRKPAVLFSGTVTEMGIPIRLPADEMQPDRPITVYDLHKLMAENYLKYYAHQGIVDGAVLRLANVYGPGPTSSSADRGVLNRMIDRALHAETLSVYGHGKYLRDYVYIDDVASAFLEAGANIDRINGQHFVIGSGEGHAIVDAFNLVADRVALKTGRRMQVISADPPVPLAAIETRNFIADTTRFSAATGWKARVPLAEGIDRTIEALLAHRSGRA